MLLYIGNVPIQVLFVTGIYLNFLDSFLSRNRTLYSRVYNTLTPCASINCARPQFLICDKRKSKVPDIN